MQTFTCHHAFGVFAWQMAFSASDEVGYRLAQAKCGVTPWRFVPCIQPRRTGLLRPFISTNQTISSKCSLKSNQSFNMFQKRTLSPMRNSSTLKLRSTSSMLCEQCTHSVMRRSSPLTKNRYITLDSPHGSEKYPGMMNPSAEGAVFRGICSANASMAVEHHVYRRNSDT